MRPRTMLLPDELWEQLQTHAIALTVKEGEPVSVSEGIRRILELAMKRAAAAKRGRINDPMALGTHPQAVAARRAK